MVALPKSLDGSPGRLSWLLVGATLRRCLSAGLEPAAGCVREPIGFCGWRVAFHQRERSDLVALQGERLRCEVLDRWLIKEAAIKWQRGTLAGDLRFWEVRR